MTYMYKLYVYLRRGRPVCIKALQEYTQHIQGAGALGRWGAPGAVAGCWFGRSLFAASATVAGLQIGRLSVVLKASAYTMYKRYLTKCVDSLKPPADGE